MNGNLSDRSVAHAPPILGAVFRWLIEQRYALANPFAGMKVCGCNGAATLDAAHAVTEGERALAWTIDYGLEHPDAVAFGAPSSGWSKAAGQRLRFLLDFGYATRLAGERTVQRDAKGRQDRCAAILAALAPLQFVELAPFKGWA